MMDTFPDLGSLSDQELKDLIQQLTEEEVDISYRRRILHGKIDILRAELVNRLRKKHEGGEEVITGADVQRLTDILAGRARRGRRPSSEQRPERRAARGAVTAPSAASSTRRARTTARSAARSSARRRSRTTRADDGDVPHRRDRASSIPVELDDVVARRAPRWSSAPAAAAWARASRSRATA